MDERGPAIAFVTLSARGAPTFIRPGVVKPNPTAKRTHKEKTNFKHEHKKIFIPKTFHQCSLSL